MINALRGKFSPKHATWYTTGFNTWWRHQMETFSALLAICAWNSPVTSEFPPQRPVTRSFDVFCDLRLNKRLSKQWWGWWFETPPRPLWRHCNDTLGLVENPPRRTGFESQNTKAVGRGVSMEKPDPTAGLAEILFTRFPFYWSIFMLYRSIFKQLI